MPMERYESSAIQGQNVYNWFDLGAKDKREFTADPVENHHAGRISIIFSYDNGTQRTIIYSRQDGQTFGI
jgi:hypothetical protein